jgi:hypothetical protein
MISKKLLKEYLTNRIKELQLEAEESRVEIYPYIKGGIDELKVLAIILDTNTFKEEGLPEQK